jgi:hypothetical protein
MPTTSVMGRSRGRGAWKPRAHAHGVPLARADDPKINPKFSSHTIDRQAGRP